MFTQVGVWKLQLCPGQPQRGYTHIRQIAVLTCNQEVAVQLTGQRVSCQNCDPFLVFVDKLLHLVHPMLLFLIHSFIALVDRQREAVGSQEPCYRVQVNQQGDPCSMSPNGPAFILVIAAAAPESNVSLTKFQIVSVSKIVLDLESIDRRELHESSP